MIYSSRPRNFPGSTEFPFYPGGLEDADGAYIDLPSVYVDTETGLVLYVVYDGHGKPMLGPGCVLLAHTVHKPPLKMVPRRPTGDVQQALVVWKGRVGAA